MHYLRVKRHGSIDLPTPRKRFCTVEGCERPRVGRGLCRLHYNRFYNFGYIGGPGLKYEFLSWENPDNIISCLMKYRKLNGECWEWMRTKSNGYGAITISGKQESVSRVSAAIYHNLDLKSDKQALHKCDNKACFNPEHIYIGDDYDNHIDRINRKRLIVDPITGDFISGLR